PPRGIARIQSSQCVIQKEDLGFESKGSGQASTLLPVAPHTRWMSRRKRFQLELLEQCLGLVGHVLHPEIAMITQWQGDILRDREIVNEPASVENDTEPTPGNRLIELAV